MRKILLALVGIVGIAFAAAPFATATRGGETAPGVRMVQIDPASAYHNADVLEPGTRGSVVEI
jgi:hypothetical protein